MSTVQQTQQTPQQSSPDVKKVGSDGEDFSDTANETATFEVRFLDFLTVNHKKKLNDLVYYRRNGANRLMSSEQLKIPTTIKSCQVSFTFCFD